MPASSQPPTRPNATDFWNNYPHYGEGGYGTEGVWELIGGNIGSTYGGKSPPTNTCAARVSRGINYGGGQPIKSAPGTNMNFTNQSYKGKAGDGKRYIISTSSLKDYLTAQWGNPDHHWTSSDVDTVAELRGVMSAGQIAIIVWPPVGGGQGHAAVIPKDGNYVDPYTPPSWSVGIGDIWVIQAQ